MNRFRRLLLDSSLREEEAPLFVWAAHIARLAEAESIEFIHAWSAPEIPPAVREKYPWLLAPGEETARSRLESLVEEHFDGPEGIDKRITVIEGNAAHAVLTHAQENDLDLIIVGRHEVTGLAEKVSRKAPCSVLTIPDGCDPGFARILVPVDFSASSEYALEVATAFGAAGKAEQITALHAFAIPQGSHRAAIPEREIAAALADYTADRLDRFIEPWEEQGVSIRPKLVQHNFAPSAVCREVAEGRHDLVVFGSRGKDAVAATLLGSTAEEILRQATVPVLTVKKKGTGLSLLRALLRT